MELESLQNTYIFSRFWKFNLNWGYWIPGISSALFRTLQFLLVLQLLMEIQQPLNQWWLKLYFQGLSEPWVGNPPFCWRLSELGQTKILDHLFSDLWTRLSKHPAWFSPESDCSSWPECSLPPCNLVPAALWRPSNTTQCVSVTGFPNNWLILLIVFLFLWLWKFTLLHCQHLSLWERF